ncbi:MAG: PfkB family carbohydrate kinase, partial [Firmicutes bacterium]|nr:PfkB family carbohydrate kinase [Bacillota bacterium]
AGVFLNIEAISKAIKKSDFIALNIISYTKQLIPLLEEAHKPIWVDLHDYQPENPYYDDFINVAEALFISSDRLPDYAEVMIEFIKRGKKLVVCTHGDKGATALDSDLHWHDCQALPYPYIDGNGAGDNFFSGFLYGYFKGYDIDKCMQYATIVAGLCISSSFIVNPNLTSDLVEKEYKRFYGK